MYIEVDTVGQDDEGVIDEKQGIKDHLQYQDEKDEGADEQEIVDSQVQHQPDHFGADEVVKKVMLMMKNEVSNVGGSAKSKVFRHQAQSQTRVSLCAKPTNAETKRCEPHCMVNGVGHGGTIRPQGQTTKSQANGTRDGSWVC